MDITDIQNICPKCGHELKLMQNRRMDEKMEIIPVCRDCKMAYRHPDLGWKLIEKEEI